MPSPKIPGGVTTIPGGPGKIPGQAALPRPSGARLRDKGRFVKGGFGFEWQGLEGVFRLPQDFNNRIDQWAKSAMERIAASMEIYGQENAVWTDRTGDARRGLKAVLITDAKGGTYTVYFGHSVDYGVFLENSNGGHFAIILPTVRHFAALLAGTIKEGPR